jgi:hydrogenase-4 component H/formate hydrogenlyase subunit 6
MSLLGEALRSLARKPFTGKYPKEKPKVPFDLRGKVVHIPDRCIYCGMCARNCPSNAITVDVKNKVWRIDYGRCLFCGQCEETCREVPKKNAIKLSSVYEIAERDRKSMIHESRGKVTPPGQRLDSG